MIYKETPIQKAIVKLLHLHNIFCHSIPNERKSSPAMGKMLKDMGRVAGVADLIVWWAIEGTIIPGYLEVKTPGGTLSNSQKEFKQLCNTHGILYDVVYGVDDVADLILSRQGCYAE